MIIVHFFFRSDSLPEYTTTPQDAATRTNTHCRKRRFLFGIFFQNIRQARTKYDMKMPKIDEGMHNNFKFKARNF